MALQLNIPVFLLLTVLTHLQPSALCAPQFPCFFIFGDSLVDNGNNNQLTTLGKANYPPYGIDFPQGPTGRFTNGRNTADIIAELLGFDTYIPPFATAVGNKDFLKGVNYASALAGIREETGHQLGDRISLDRQLQNHNLTVSLIADSLGSNTSAKQHLSQCLYYFVIGSNDYLNNYYLPEYYPTGNTFTPEDYATVLVKQYSQQLRTLYAFGARKFSVSGLGPMGCLPSVVARGTNGSACAESINNAARLFNDKLKVLVNELNSNFADAKFVYISAMDLRPADLFAPAIRLLSEPCCKLSNTTGLCINGEGACPVRALHLFYDTVHPTEIVNKAVGAAAYVEICGLIS